MNKTILLALLLMSPLSLRAQVAASFHVLPQVADGQFTDGTSIITQFIVTNVNTGSTTCTLTMYGVPMDRLDEDATPATFTMDGQGFLAFLVTGGQEAIVSGYATLSCDGSVTVLAIYASLGPEGLPSGPDLRGLATVFSSAQSSVAAMPVMLLQNVQRLAVAFANDTDSAIEVDLAVFGEGGIPLVTGRVMVPARSNVARFLDELSVIPFGTSGEFGGQLVLTGVDSAKFYTIGLLFVGPIYTTIPATQFAP